jgi:hypothetical protein
MIKIKINLNEELFNIDFLIENLEILSYFVYICTVERAIVFDTLEYSKKLKAAGFTDQQAEVQAEALADMFENQIATKRDLRELESRLLIRLGGMLAIAVGLIAAIEKLIK